MERRDQDPGLEDMVGQDGDRSFDVSIGEGTGTTGPEGDSTDGKGGSVRDPGPPTGQGPTTGGTAMLDETGNVRT
jgi:hypothetical protein